MDREIWLCTEGLPLDSIIWKPFLNPISVFFVSNTERHESDHFQKRKQIELKLRNETKRHKKIDLEISLNRILASTIQPLSKHLAYLGIFFLDI